MAVTAQVFRNGGVPVRWNLWGQARVSPGQTTAIGSGFTIFNVTGVQGGAIFQYGPYLNITLRFNGVSSQLFQLYDDINAGQYRAEVL